MTLTSFKTRLLWRRKQNTDEYCRKDSYFIPSLRTIKDNLRLSTSSVKYDILATLATHYGVPGLPPVLLATPIRSPKTCWVRDGRPTSVMGVASSSSV